MAAPKFFLILVFFVLFVQVQARNDITHNKSDTLSKMYIGIGSGLNNYNGIIGLGASARVYKGLFLRGGAGIGSWGYKYTVGLQLGRNRVHGWSAGIGYSTCTGVNNITLNTEVQSGSGSSVSKDVLMDLHRVNTFNFYLTRNWILGRNILMHLDLGYSYLLQTKIYTVKDGSVLTQTAESAMRVSSPGGLIVGFGFMFGL